MPVKFVPLMLLLLPGCSLLPLFKGMPFQIKAGIDGEIKGHKIHCERTIDLADGKWAVMCKVGNDVDVKYRVRPMGDDLAQIEFIVGKSKEDGHRKIIAAPTVVVKREQRARTVTTSKNSNIIVMAEHVK